MLRVIVENASNQMLRQMRHEKSETAKGRREAKTRERKGRSRVRDSSEAKALNARVCFQETFKAISAKPRGHFTRRKNATLVRCPLPLRAPFSTREPRTQFIFKSERAERDGLLLGLDVVLEDGNSKLLSLSGRNDALGELGIERGVEDRLVILLRLVGNLKKVCEKKEGSTRSGG